MKPSLLESGATGLSWRRRTTFTLCGRNGHESPDSRTILGGYVKLRYACPLLQKIM